MPSNTRRKNVIHAVGSALASVITLLALAVTSLNVGRFQQAAAWPTVAGTIIHSTHVRGCGGAGKAYYPVLRYKFQINGLEHEGEQVMFGGERCGSQSAAKSIADQYSAGTPIRVSLNPQEPTQAVLLVGQVSLDTWVPMGIFAILFLISATAACVYAIRARSNHSLQPMP